MGGIVGKLFREFAVTLSVAIAVSLCVSLTTTPMMCAKFLRSQKDKKHGRLYLAGERCFNEARIPNTSGLRWVLRHQRSCSRSRARRFASASTCISSFQRDFSAAGYGRIAGNIIGAQDLSYPAMQEKLKQYTDIVMSDPAVADMSSNTGGGRKTRAECRLI